MLKFPFEIYLVELGEDNLLARECIQGTVVGLGSIVLGAVRLFELIHYLFHLRAGKARQHCAKTLQRLHIVAFQFVAVVLGDDRIQLARNTIQGCANLFLGQFLPRQAVTTVGLGLGFRRSAQQEWQGY